MNIMSCHGFSKSPILTVILSCLSDLFTYYLSKGFVIVETEEGGLDNISISLKKKVNAVNLHNEESILPYKSAITSIFNTLKITIPRDVYDTYV